jgi:FkbM family methyltransferase
MKVSDMFYSQFGEDKILFKFFRGKTHGICVEVGANDGVNDSTSFFFERLGWACVLIEPNPVLCQEIRKVRNALLYECAASSQSGTTILHVAEGAERSHGVSTISNDKEVHDKIKSYGFSCRPIEVQTRSLDDILMDAQLNGCIDFISLVLEGFSIERWKPTIILIEDNSNFENNAVSNYLKKLGYARFMRTGVNDWYAPRANKELVNIKNQVLYKCIAYKTRLKNNLRKIPLVVKLVDFLKKIGAW